MSKPKPIIVTSVDSGPTPAQELRALRTSYFDRGFGPDAETRRQLEYEAECRRMGRSDDINWGTD